MPLQSLETMPSSWPRFYNPTFVFNMRVTSFKLWFENYTYINNGNLGFEEIKSILGDTKIDLIIDDASHKQLSLHKALALWSNILKKGGNYILEDINCNRSRGKLLNNAIFKKFKATGYFDSDFLTNGEKEIIHNNFDYRKM